jgi:hypothetical protein
MDFFSLHDPAAPHGLVKVDNGPEKTSFGLDMSEFGGEEVPIGVQDLEITGISVFIPHPGKATVGAKRLDLTGLGLEFFP